METSVVMAAASDKQTLVQVPADLLESLITTVDSLQKELKEVKNDLAKTQQNHGVQFPQFSKLPLHVRRIIWAIACQVPQVHRITRSSLSRSFANAIAATNKESASVLHSLQLDCFGRTYNRRVGPGDASEYVYARSYVNMDLDTVWLSEGHCSIATGKRITLSCSQCTALDPDEFCPRCKNEEYINSRMLWRGIKRLPRLATNYTDWLTTDDKKWPSLKRMFIDRIEILAYHEVEELLLVVGPNYSDFVKEPLVIFVTPPTPPQFRMESEDIEDLIIPFHKFSKPLTWLELATNVIGYLENYKSNRAKRRAAWLTRCAAESLTDEEAREALDDDGYTDLSHWTIPKVRFVLATTEALCSEVSPEARRLLKLPIHQ